MSWIPSELETLIPPYTSIKMLKESVESSVKHYEVKVARDNKYVNYDSDHSADFDVESDVSDKAQYEPSDQSEHEDNNLHQNKINPLPQNIATNHNQIEDIEENVGIEENDQNIEHINNITNNSKEHDLNENIDLNINFNISNGPAENTMQDQIQDQTQDPNTTRPSDLKSNKKSIMFSYCKLNRNYIKTKYSRVS